MYWFPRPPYVRYTLAALVLMAAIWLDIRPADTVLYPVARTDLPAGTELDDRSIEWRPLPAGVLPPPVVDGRLIRPVAAGEPLRASDLASDVAAAPTDWWSLELALPTGVVAGQPLRLVVLPVQGVDPPDPIPAIVVAPGRPGSGLGGGATRGLVAVPPEQAGVAAAAAAENRVTILIGSVG